MTKYGIIVMLLLLYWYDLTVLANIIVISVIIDNTISFLVKEKK